MKQSDEETVTVRGEERKVSEFDPEKPETKTICLDCGADEGTLLKEFDSEKNYFWSELAEMTPVCACCGSENLKEQNDSQSKG